MKELVLLLGISLLSSSVFAVTLNDLNSALRPHTHSIQGPNQIFYGGKDIHDNQQVAHSNKALWDREETQAIG
jgi:hypothetical protein